MNIKCFVLPETILGSRNIAMKKKKAKSLFSVHYILVGKAVSALKKNKAGEELESNCWAVGLFSECLVTASLSQDLGELRE